MEKMQLLQTNTRIGAESMNKSPIARMQSLKTPIDVTILSSKRLKQSNVWNCTHMIKVSL